MLLRNLTTFKKIFNFLKGAIVSNINKHSHSKVGYICIVLVNFLKFIINSDGALFIFNIIIKH